jgi:tetratricopeptide (TPR) repeat protein
LRLKLLYAKGKTIEIDEDYIGVFGRDNNCDLYVEDSLLSRQHGEFYVDQGRLYVRDLGSKNGIFIKRKKIADEEVKPGDKIKLGNKNFFQLLDENEVEQKQHAVAPAIIEQPDVTDAYIDDEIEDALIVQEPQEMALAQAPKEQSSDLVPTKSGASEKDKQLRKTLIYLLIGGFFVVASLSFYKGDKPDKKEPGQKSGPMSKSVYQKTLDKAALHFVKKEFQDSIDSLKPAIKNFNNNDAAAIISSLSEEYMDVGEKYEKFNWGKVESLAKELLDSHPVSEGAKKIAGRVLKWIDKEEPMMTKIQKVMDIIKKEKWSEALTAAEKLPKDSAVIEKYREDLNDIKKQYVKHYSRNKEIALKKENWEEAITQIKRLKRTSETPDALDNEITRYQRYIRDRDSIADINDLIEKTQFNDAKDQLSLIEEDSPYYLNVKRLTDKADMGLSKNQLRNLYRTGNVKKALELAKKTKSKDALLLSKMKQVDVLYDSLQKAIKDSPPEALAPICKKIMLLEPSKNNYYHKSAKDISDKWTDSSVLAQYYVKLGDAAYNAGAYVKAREMYSTANTKDDFYGTEGIKLMDKQGVSYYNKAVHAKKMKKNKDSSSYLRKALKLLPKDSRYYDRMIKMVEELSKGE